MKGVNHPAIRSAGQRVPALIQRILGPLLVQRVFNIGGSERRIDFPHGRSIEA